MDMIVKRRDVVQVASEEWKMKWAPAITAYSQSLRGKVGKDCKSIVAEMYLCECYTYMHARMHNCGIIFTAPCSPFVLLALLYR